MRIATLQFAPKLGEVSANINRANALLSSFPTPLTDIDLLVLPELAFSGYNHPSLTAILPLLEPTSSGPSTEWAKLTAAKYGCVVSVGYPELHAPPSGPPTFNSGGADSTEKAEGARLVAYNSTVTVSPSGQILAHYRKTHLYYTDETWAKEGPEGFTTTTLKFRHSRNGHGKEEKVAWGICMDLNPYKFTAPWDKYEFTNAAIASEANMVVVSTAWLTSLTAEELKEEAKRPDMYTFSYWAERFKPLIRGETGVVVVVANRCGEEPGGSDHMRREVVRYAGTSWVGMLGHRKMMVWEIMGRAEEGVLVADLDDRLPKYTFELAAPEEKEDVEEERERLEVG